MLKADVFVASRVLPSMQSVTCCICVCVCVQLAAQWLVIGSGDVSLYLQREIGLSTFLAAIQTYCLKVRCPHHTALLMCKCNYSLLSLAV